MPVVDVLEVGDGGARGPGPIVQDLLLHPPAQVVVLKLEPFADHARGQTRLHGHGGELVLFVSRPKGARLPIAHSVSVDTPSRTPSPAAPNLIKILAKRYNLCARSYPLFSLYLIDTGKCTVKNLFEKEPAAFEGIHPHYITTSFIIAIPNNDFRLIVFVEVQDVEAINTTLSENFSNFRLFVNRKEREANVTGAHVPLNTEKISEISKPNRISSDEELLPHFRLVNECISTLRLDSEFAFLLIRIKAVFVLDFIRTSISRICQHLELPKSYHFLSRINCNAA